VCVENVTPLYKYDLWYFVVSETIKSHWLC
jgi:hypothetical protein